VIPSVNTVGEFAFSAPYDTLINSSQQLTVMGIHSLVELQASGQDPLNAIYIAAGDTEVSFNADLAANRPIVLFSTESGEFIYVPSNNVISDNKLTGIPYVEKSLIVNLGYLPTDYDLTLVTQLVNDNVYNSIGVTPQIIPTDTSGTVRVGETKHLVLDASRNGAKTVTKSYKTLYEETLALYNAQLLLIQNIETVYKTNGIAG